MLVIRVLMDVQESKVPAFLETLKAEGETVRKLEGCERYTCFQEAGSSNRFLLFEEWRDAASFEAYRGSDIFTESGKRIFPLLTGKPDSAYYQGEKVGP